MRRITVNCLVFLFLSLNSFSQTAGEKKYSLTTINDDVAFGMLSITDPYLSPQTYSGVGVSYSQVRRSYFKPENINFSRMSKLSATGALAMNPSFSSAMTYMGFTYNWGAFYHYRKLKNLHILVGSNADGQFGFKSISRNVNNPVNLDMAVNLNAAALLRYDLKTRRKTYRLNYELETPLIGCMYVPLVGASYYEMFELGDLSNAIHFSSLHNKAGLKSALTIDIPLRRSTLSCGVNSQSLIYKANDLVFKYNSFALQVGFKYDLYVFRGKNNPAPANFISTEK